MPSVAAKVTRLSIQLFWLNAAMVPRSMPTPNAKAIETAPMMSVTGQARRTTSTTVSVGLWNGMPKSPRSIAASQLTYCSKTGRSRPYLAAMLSIMWQVLLVRERAAGHRVHQREHDDRERGERQQQRPRRRRM